MADTGLLLGPIVFRGFEVPARINFGGAQRVALHRLVGGARVINLLGRDDAELRFEGIFSGPDATVRARTLDELRAAGAPLPLTWDVFFYTVILTRFEADYRSGWWIPFRVGCTVLRDEAAALNDTVVSLADGLAADLASAAANAAGTELDLSVAQTAVSAPNATALGSADFVTAQSALAAAQSNVGLSIQQAESNLNGIGLATASTASAGISGLTAAVSGAGQLAALNATQNYLGRATINLANAST